MAGIRVALLALAILASSCQASQPHTFSSDPGDLRGDWLVVAVNDAPARDLGVVVTFDNGAVTTDNVCNAFTVSYGYGEGTILRLPLDTTVTYAGVGCVTGDDIDDGLLRLLYFNGDPTTVTIDGSRLRLMGAGMTAEFSR